jgi:hypothetical protein
MLNLKKKKKITTAKTVYSIVPASFGSWSSAARIATGYRMYDEKVGVRDPAGSRIFLLHAIYG